MRVISTQAFCRTHWFKFPKHIQDAVWRSYRGRGSLEHAGFLVRLGARLSSGPDAGPWPKF